MRVFKKEYAFAYDYLYQDKDYEKECDFIQEVFKKFTKGVKTVLDLGCGTGGHALILAKRGYEIVGVDRSKEMLKIARDKAKSAKLDVEFIESDITNIGSKRKFDAVISMFAVMSYQTANSSITAVCKLVEESLVSGGLFVFDCWHGPAVLLDRPTTCIKEIKSNSGERIIRFTEPLIDIMNHIVKVNFRVWRIKNGKFKESFETHSMRFLFPQEIKYFLEVAGFKKIAFCPFLELEKQLTENDWNMTVIAKT